MSVVLAARDLTLGYAAPDGTVTTVVDGAALTLTSGAIVGLAGESGCGKSTTALAAIGYRAPGSRVLAGSSTFDGQDLLALDTEQLRPIWGRRIAFLAQNASAALNPAIRVGRQLEEILKHHLGLHGDELRARQLELFESVLLPDPEHALRRYPHEFSGGQQQRIAIAMALACRPDILVMDEPTTGLDVTTQKQISTLLRTIVDETQVAALYVSHDLALLAEIADRLVVMYAGEIVEAGPMQTVVGAPRHPYTRALLNAVPSARYRAQTTGIPGTPPSRTVTDKCAFAPRCHRALPACSTQHAELDPVAPDHAVRCMNPEPLGSARVSGGEAAASGVRAAEAAGALLTLDAITCEYRSVGRTTVAANAVSISIAEGETVGIVGESGSGKSTLLRAIVGLHAPSSGTIRLRGEELAGRAIKRPRKTRADIQLVFQNPRSALNPRQTVLEAIARPARLFSDISKAEARQLAGELLDDVRLSQSILSRYPGELSGGQQQRVALARAFATRPSVVLLDEVTSALDVSVQATIVDLIRELGPQHGATVIFVSHDLAVVRSLCERAIVMRNGEICEQGDTETLFRSPSDQYTRALVDAIPELGLVATR